MSDGNPRWFCLTCKAWADVSWSTCVYVHRWTFRPDGAMPRRFAKGPKR